MSRLTAIVIVLALAADFFLLPSLLVFMEGSTRRAESEDGPLLQTTR